MKKFSDMIKKSPIGKNLDSSTFDAIDKVFNRAVNRGVEIKLESAKNQLNEKFAEDTKTYLEKFSKDNMKQIVVDKAKVRLAETILESFKKVLPEMLAMDNEKSKMYKTFQEKNRQLETQIKLYHSKKALVERKLEIDKKNTQRKKIVVESKNKVLRKKLDLKKIETLISKSKMPMIAKENLVVEAKEMLKNRPFGTTKIFIEKVIDEVMINEKSTRKPKTMKRVKLERTNNRTNNNTKPHTNEEVDFIASAMNKK